MSSCTRSWALHIAGLDRSRRCTIKNGGRTGKSAGIFQGPSVIDITSTWQTLAISIRAASVFVTSGGTSVPFEIRSYNHNTAAHAMDIVIGYPTVLSLTPGHAHQCFFFWHSFAPPYRVVITQYCRLLWRFRQGMRGLFVGLAILTGLGGPAPRAYGSRCFHAMPVAPKWIIPQFRAGTRGKPIEGQQQVFHVTFPGILN